MSKHPTRSAVSIAAALLLGAQSLIAPAAAAEIEIKLGHDQPITSTYHGVVLHFAERLAEETDGRVELKIFPGGQLGSETAMLEGLEAGNVEIAISAAANASTYVPSFGIFSVGYLFADKDHFVRTLQDEEFNRLVDAQIEEADTGFRRIATITAGLRNVYSNQGPVLSIADIKGQKMRVMASPIESEVWSALGALPLAMPMGEVYTGMQTGLLQAAENAAGNYAGTKHYEVAPYYSLTGHQWLICFIFASDRTWNKLPADVQDAILKVGKELPAFGVDFAVQNDAKELQAIVAAHDVKVNEVDAAPFMTHLAPLQNDVAGRMGVMPILERIRALQ